MPRATVCRGCRGAAFAGAAAPVGIAAASLPLLFGGFFAAGRLHTRQVLQGLNIALAQLRPFAAPQPAWQVHAAVPDTD